MRVEDAKEMLATTKATAEEIAIECGFGEPLRFRRAFKRVTGTNPGAYRAATTITRGNKPATTHTNAARPYSSLILSSAMPLVSTAEAMHRHAPATDRQEHRQEPGRESVRMKILRLLGKNTLGRNSLARQLGHRKISGWLNEVIRMLLTDRAIEWTIPDKPNSPLQQYRLTAKGRLAIADH